MASSEKSMCIVCGVPAGLMCQRCAEPYCKEECQRLDWQRHKYYCIVMPPLVSYKPLQKSPNSNVALAAISPKSSDSIKKPIPAHQDTVESTSVIVKDQELSKNWRDHMLPNGKEFFDCRVTFMENDGPIWVVNVDDIESMECMTDTMQRCMQNQELIPMKYVKKNTLVILNVENKVHRGHVLTVRKKKKEADVQLIDFGPIVSTLFHDIYLIVPKMAEYNAFAFRVKLPTNTGVQVNKNLTLRLLGTKTHNGVYHVHIKPTTTIPLNLPVEILQLNPEVKVIRIFVKNKTLNEPHCALLKINAIREMNDDLKACFTGKPGQQFTEPFSEEKGSFFVAARTEDGFRRAILLDHIEGSTPMFLVYEIDEGRVSVTTKLSRIPSELLGLPIRVFAAEIKDTVPKELETEGAQLSVKFKTLNPLANEKLRTAHAALLANGEQICMAQLSTFLGLISDLGHKFWRETINDYTTVYITHVVTYKELYISSPKAKKYEEIFKRLESKCAPIQESSEVSIGSIVLVISKDIKPFRGEIMSIEEEDYYVLNIDTGVTKKVELTAMRKSCRFLENLPVYLVRVKLNTVCNIPDAAVPVNNDAIDLLIKLSTTEKMLTLKIVDESTSTVDLLSNSSDQRSLVAQMMPLLFTSLEKNNKAAQPEAQKESVKNCIALPLSPPKTPASVENSSKTIENASANMANKESFERFLFNAVPKNPVALGDKVTIIILNVNDMPEKGFITACSFENEKVAKEFQDLLILVAQHGACDDKNVPGYIPGIGEMCLAVFSEDKSWYRGVCQEVRGNRAKIIYCDFGNSEYVALENLKPIPFDLLGCVYATKCFIDGFDKSENLAALKHLLLDEGKILCKVKIGPEPDTRLITISNLQSILNTPSV